MTRFSSFSTEELQAMANALDMASASAVNEEAQQDLDDLFQEIVEELHRRGA